jgi:hypothetical protein
MRWFLVQFRSARLPAMATSLPIVLIGIVAASTWVAPGASPCRAAAHRNLDLFGPVFSIMNNTGDNMGCIGCHIGDKPTGFLWFGGDQATVLQTFETGVTPDGEVIGPIPVDGGRNGLLAFLLHNGYMPRYGTPWGDDELALLDAWLSTYE